MNEYWKPLDFDRMLLEDKAADTCQMTKDQGYDSLLDISRSLDKYSSEEIQTIISFLCKDPVFNNLTEGKASNLHAFLNGVYSTEALNPISDVARGWGLWKWANEKTVKGLADWMKAHNPNTIDDAVFEKKAKVPNIKDFETLQDGITKALPLLEKLVSGTPVPDNQLQAAIKAMGFNIEMSKFDNYSGHLYALLVSAIKGVGIHLAAAVMVVLIGAVSLGILAIPAAVYASIWAGMKQNAAYKQAYEKWQADSSMIEKGWNKSAFLKAMQTFRLHYRGIMGYATKLDKLNGGEIFTRQETAHSRLFADVILLEVKTEARILGTVVSVADKILSLSL